MSIHKLRFNPLDTAQLSNLNLLRNFLNSSVQDFSCESGVSTCREVELFSCERRRHEPGPELDYDLLAEGTLKLLQDSLARRHLFRLNIFLIH
jgi:hypothetical protein